jgi:hypothetical protein
MAETVPPTVVYISYGSEANQVLLLRSLQSFVAAGLTQPVLIFTDRPAYLERYLAGCPIREKIILHPITAETIRLWRGEQNFTHRLKIQALAEAFRLTQSPLLYLDADIVILRSMQEVFDGLTAGKAFMQVLESELARPAHALHRKVKKKLNAFSFTYPPELSSRLGLQPTFRLHHGLSIWNAGVLGLPLWSEPCLEAVTLLCDALYLAQPYHIAEQMAFSFILSEKTTLHPTPQLSHYWKTKDAYLALLLQRLPQAHDYQSLVQAFEGLPHPESLKETKPGFWAKLKKSIRKRLQLRG